MDGNGVHIALVAGEASGDRLGAALIEGIRQRCPSARFSGIAGPYMRAAGCEALADSETLSVMGLAEVVAHLPRLLRLRRRVARHYLAQPPSLFVGIDAPDFNLGLEKRLRRHGIRTLHWVSPSVWAWRRYRVNRIRDSVDRVLTLFPFESVFYRDRRVSAEFVGHPLADAIDGDCGRSPARAALGLDPDAPCLALLPGSRRAEIARLLPVFVQAADRCRQALAQLQVILPVAGETLMDDCRRILRQAGSAGGAVRLLRENAHTAMCAADAVLLASGTATLECLLLRRPMVVAYRMHPFSYPLVRRLLKVPHVALPNILLGRRQVPEFLQGDASARNLAEALLDLLQDPAAVARQVAPFAALHRQLRRDSIARVSEVVLQQLSTE